MNHMCLQGCSKVDIIIMTFMHVLTKLIYMTLYWNNQEIYCCLQFAVYAYMALILYALNYFPLN